MAQKTKITQDTLYGIATAQRYLEMASRNCHKVEFQRYAKELRRYARLLRENGAEVDMKRATERNYLYEMARRIIQEKEKM